MLEIFVRPERCMGCRSCEIACAVQHSGSKNLFGALADKPEPRKRLYVEMIGGQRMPLLCHHCDEAPCVAVCRTGATSKDKSRASSRKTVTSAWAAGSALRSAPTAWSAGKRRRESP